MEMRIETTRYSLYLSSDAHKGLYEGNLLPHASFLIHFLFTIIKSFHGTRKGAAFKVRYKDTGNVLKRFSQKKDEQCLVSYEGKRLIDVYSTFP